jgi:hypothetical protein
MRDIVKSGYSVSTTDKHRYFLYYLPPKSGENLGINEWGDQQFMRLTQVLETEGIDSSSPDMHIPDYERSILENLYRVGFILDEKYFHLAYPLLILCREPLATNPQRPKVMLISLKKCGDERVLEAVFDSINSVMITHDWSLLKKMRKTLGNKFKSSQASVIEVTELTWSFNSWGININLLLNLLLQRFKK